MKIKEIRAVPVNLTPRPKTKPRSKQDPDGGNFISPMDRYKQEITRTRWYQKWATTACVVTAEDGSWGLGIAPMAGPVCSIINDHYNELLSGENPIATERLWDLMYRSSTPYGISGITSYAISAVDNAIWDLKGKLMGYPVYELLGGPVKKKIPCYASNTNLSYPNKNNISWFLELGFKAVKVFLRHGPEEGIAGLRKNEELVAETRELIGPDIELAVDSWMSLNTEYAVRLVETLRKYHIKWLEDYFLPEDMNSYSNFRSRVPGQTLATGEHWYTIHPFASAAKTGVVDILQPDANWVGGITSIIRICHIAEANGLTVITHGGMNYPYGQHIAAAMPVIPWGERSEGVSPPGIPLEEMAVLPGTSIIKEGYLTPSDKPGFGMELSIDWLEKRAV